MGFVKELSRLKLKEKNKKLFKVTLKVDKSEVTKSKEILNYDKNRVNNNIQNKQEIYNFSNQLAKNKIDDIVDNEDVINNNVKNVLNSDKLNNIKCFKPASFLFNAALGLVTGGPMGGLMGGLMPTIQCLGNQYLNKIE